MGSHFDLPIAIAILVESGQIREPAIKDIAFAGELSLNGELRPVRGIINIAETMRAAGYKILIVPHQNAKQAALLSGIEIIAAKDLTSVYLHLLGEKKLTPVEHTDEVFTSDYSIDVGDIRGQDEAKRALVIAAAGGHNILLDGPPGAGKTMLANALVSLLPPPSYEEQIEITKLHSLVGEETDDIVRTRPFRSPHHTASYISLIGGGANPLPGEVSLAHNGVLFLDELPEYPRASLESLRQPLEDRLVHISRASNRVSYPANFMLVATKNPCPCGYYGDPHHECSCTVPQLLNYQKRVSGPLLDRIDMVITVQRVPEKDLLHHNEAPAESPKLRENVVKARGNQSKRNKKGVANALLPSKNIAKSTLLSDEAAELLNTATDRLKLSARSYFKLIKVARTIADLEESETIEPSHMAEGLQYRRRESDIR